MDIDNNIHMQSSPQVIMVIAEERNTLRTLFDDNMYVSSELDFGVVFDALNLRSRFNPDLRFYKVFCEEPIRYGLTADELFEIIQEAYENSNYQSLDELFSYIERI